MAIALYRNILEYTVIYSLRFIRCISKFEFLYFCRYIYVDDAERMINDSCLRLRISCVLPLNL